MNKKKSFSHIKRFTVGVIIVFAILLVCSIILTIIDFTLANLISTISILLGLALSVLLDLQQKQINKQLNEDIKEQKEDLDDFKNEPLVRSAIDEHSIKLYLGCSKPNNH